MKRIILCEGKTDAILLGYYLCKVSGWNFSKKAPSGLAIKPHADNENVAWYTRDSEWLMICAVGGKDNFLKFFNRDINTVILNEDGFSHIALITDRDDRNIDEIANVISNELTPFFKNIKNGEWHSNQYVDMFGIQKSIDSLFLVIPKDQQGALETVMLSAISEDPYDRDIVQRCIDFVSEMRSIADRYISSDRLQLKANLSAVWAIQSPEKAFDFIDQQIKAVAWEKYDILRECFGVLEKI